jgi:hypothetical protein
VESFAVRHFVSRPIAPAGDALVTHATGGEPPVPRAFLWDDRTFIISEVIRNWRTTKTDRGDAYLKRHWFELRTACGKRLEVYYDRQSRRGESRWWLYAIEE